MTSFQHGEIRSRLKNLGLTERDLGWLDSFNWADSAVPAITTENEARDYVRREKVLNASVAGLLAHDRAEAVEGKLAAAIGAQVANWNERGEEEED